MIIPFIADNAAAIFNTTRRQSALTLLVLRVLGTDDPDDTATAYHLAPVTHRFYWRSDFHFTAPFFY